MSDVSAKSWTQSPLVYYNTYTSNPGIYLEWEKTSPIVVYSYDIARSDSFDGDYLIIDTVYYPTQEYVDTTGNPSNYYKIYEADIDGNTLSTHAPMRGEELLIKSSLRYELEHLLNVPIYDEEVIFHKDRSRASVAFPYWNSFPKPEIRITGLSEEGDRDALIPLDEITSIYKTINKNFDPIAYSRDGDIVNFDGGNNYSTGLKIKYDYDGNIFFIDDNNDPVSIQSYDTVFCTYYVKAFTNQHMNSALNLALQTINAQPGSRKYTTVADAPYYYDPAIIYGACYYLLRNLLVQLTQRQRRLLFEDPDASMFSNIKEAAGMYKEEFDKQLEKLPIAVYPGIRGVVVPEFNMPGGRSRFFRYIWNLGTGG